jgi:hypothetical protein
LRKLPLTLYVPTDYPDGNGELWRLGLEENELELCRNDTLWRLPASTVPEKLRAFEDLYWYLRDLKTAVTTRKGMLFPDHRSICRGRPSPCGIGYSRSTPRERQSGRCIQRMSRPAGTTQARPADRK